MLETLTFAAAFGLLLYGGYAAHWLVPRRHPFETLALFALCTQVGLVAAAPWVEELPDPSWPGSLLIITIFVVVTIWRREAATFVRCRFGAPEPEHPLRRRADYAAGQGRLT